MRQPAPRSPLFPYTTLFRSSQGKGPAGFWTGGRARSTAALVERQPGLGGGPGAAAGAGPVGARLDERPQRRAAERQPEPRSEEHTSELQSRRDLVCRLLLEK